MKITTRAAGNCVVLDCSGRLTLGPATQVLRNTVREALKEGVKKIVLNLRDVNYIDSAGIGELVSSFTHVQKGGSTLVLLNMAKRIRDLLVITKLYAVFEVFEDEESALAEC